MNLKRISVNLSVFRRFDFGEWSAAVEKQRKQAKPMSNGSTRDPGSTYSCLDPACTLTFDSMQDAEDHMDTGEHMFTPENEKI